MTLDELTRTDTLVTGCVRYRDLVYLVTQDDAISPQIEHSHLYTVDAGLLGYGGVRDWASAAVTVCRHPHEQMLLMSPHGHVRLCGSGLESEERIADGDDSPATLGLLRDVRGIGRRAYAVGMNRQVYRRDGADTWTGLHDTLRAASGEVKGFEAIDGFSEEDIYAAGWDGEIWHFDGAAWHPEPSPTDRVITALVCAGDGCVYAAARAGLLIRGRAGSWEVLVHQPTLGSISDLAWYQDRLYLATSKGLFRLDGAVPVSVEFGDDKPATCHTLSAADGVLYTFGSKDIFAFDGKCWQRMA